MSIYELKPGEKALIENISGDEKLTKRLLALGCTEGAEVIVKTTAPLGDPIMINLRGANLAIRKKDAKNIFVRNLAQ